jgi:hypothetical protein
MPDAALRPPAARGGAPPPPPPPPRRPRDPLGRVLGLLQDELRPLVQVPDLRPPVVELVDVDLVVDVHELEQVEQEQRHVPVRDRRDVRDARGARHPRVELAEPQIAGLGVQEEVELEVSAVPLLAQTFAHRDGALARHPPLRLGEELGRHVVAAPSAVVGRELLEADELRHQRAHEGPVPGDHPFDRELPRLDPLHHLDLLAGHLLLEALPIGLVGDEERRLPRVAVRRLDHQVGPEPGAAGEGEQVREARRRPHRVRDARDPRVVAQARRLDLRVESMPERGRRERDVEPELLRELFRLLVEHQERGLPPAALPNQVGHLLVAEEVVHDLLDRLEGSRRPLTRDEHVRVPAVERVVVVDEPERPDPPVDPEQVERRGAHEVDRRLGRSEEVPDRRDPGQGLRPDCELRRRGALEIGRRDVALHPGDQGARHDDQNDEAEEPPEGGHGPASAAHPRSVPGLVPTVRARYTGPGRRALRPSPRGRQAQGVDASM